MSSLEKPGNNGIKFSELCRDFQNDIKFPERTRLEVFNADGSVRKDPLSGGNLILEVFINKLGKKAIRILGESKKETGAYGRYFLESLATTIFHTDSVVFNGSDIDLTDVDKKVFFKITKEKKPETVTPPLPTPKPQVEEIRYLTLEQLYNYWGENRERLDDVLNFINYHRNERGLLDSVVYQFNKEKVLMEHLLIPKTNFYNNPDNIKRLISLLVTVKSLLEQQKTETAKKEIVETVNIVPPPEKEVSVPTRNIKEKIESDDFDLENFDWSVAKREVRLRFLALAQGSGFSDSNIADIIGKTNNTLIGFRSANHVKRLELTSRYNFSIKLRQEFFLKYGNPKSLPSRVWSEAKKQASRIAKKIRSMGSGLESQKRGKGVDKVGVRNTQKYSMENAENKKAFSGNFLQESKYAFEYPENKRDLEQKFDWLIFLLRGMPREKFGTSALSGINLRSGNPVTLRTKPIVNDIDKQLVPTIDILLEADSPKDSFKKGLYYLIYSEFEKIKNGETSRLTEFLTLDEKGNFSNRLGLTLVFRDDSSWKRKFPSSLETIYFPPQDGIDYSVNYDRSEFAEAEANMKMPSSNSLVLYEKKDDKKPRRTGRFSELSESGRRVMEGRGSLPERIAQPDKKRLLPPPKPRATPERNIIKEKTQFIVSRIMEEFVAEGKHDALKARKISAYFFRVKMLLPMQEIGKYVGHIDMATVTAYVGDILDEIQIDRGYRNKLDTLWNLIDGEWNTLERGRDRGLQ